MMRDRASEGAGEGKVREGYVPAAEPSGPAHGAGAGAHIVGAAEVRAIADAGEDPTPPEQHPLGEPPTTLTMPATQMPGGTTRVTVAALRENMPLLGADGETVGTVDGPDAGDTIRLMRDTLGQPHWVPLAWIARVDDQAHLDRAARQARQEWLTSAPA